MEQEMHHYHHSDKDDEIKVKLIKGAKSYQWEITCAGNNDGVVLERLFLMDNELSKRTKETENGEDKETVRST